MASFDEKESFFPKPNGTDFNGDPTNPLGAEALTPSALAAAAETQSRLQCRMYENKYPEVDDLVVVTVTQIAELGAYVQLLEYNNIEGMILHSELSRRRIRSIQKLVRVGRNEVVVVIKIDKEKGYIDLSKRRVSPEDIAKCEDKFRKSGLVHGIMRHVAQKQNLSLEDLYADVCWPLYKEYGHAYEAFKLAITDSEKVFKNLTMTPEVRKELISMIRRRLTPQAIKMRADIEVTCFGYEGIDAIKEALAAGESVSTPEVPVKIKLVAPPLYVMITHSLDLSSGIELLDKGIAKIEEALKKHSGNLTVKLKPKAVTETDDTELDAMFERAKLENEEVGGDDDDVELEADEVDADEAAV